MSGAKQEKKECKFECARCEAASDDDWENYKDIDGLEYCVPCLRSLSTKWLAVVEPKLREVDRVLDVDLGHGEEVPCDNSDCWYSGNLDRIGEYYDTYLVVASEDNSPYADNCGPPPCEERLCDVCFANTTTGQCHGCKRYTADDFLDLSGDGKLFLCYFCAEDAVQFTEESLKRKRERYDEKERAAMIKLRKRAVVEVIQDEDLSERRLKALERAAFVEEMALPWP